MSSRLLIRNLGYPRIGSTRQLKKAVEGFWDKSLTESELQQAARELRRANWLHQKSAGVDLIPSNDFSFYDPMLDTAAMVHAVPARFGFTGGAVGLPLYFAMARGQGAQGANDACGCGTSGSLAAMEMTKWFDTNYHYIVPEFTAGQSFRVSCTKVVSEFSEALELGIKTVPVIVGPITFLKLGKLQGDAPFDRFELLDNLLSVYTRILQQLRDAGAEWVQFDEPILSMDLTEPEREHLKSAYSTLAASAPELKLLVANYFGTLRENLVAFFALPVAGLHIDAAYGGSELRSILADFPNGCVLSLGVVNGRNIWKNDYKTSLEQIESARKALGDERVMLAPSCSLNFVPVSLTPEKKLPSDVKSWLAFADEKLAELADLRRIVEGDTELLGKNIASLKSRAANPRIHKAPVKARCDAVNETDLRRAHPFLERREAQQARLKLPLFPTTTIGSFPQTDEVRSKRALYRACKLSAGDYRTFLETETARVIRWQEDIGLDVLVHGEFERTDMVEYFGENLDGFAFTENGWVQSYGSRCVKPPIIFGDVERRKPMTVSWSRFAQGQTSKPMKGMLTGPITILQWSFVRDDQPRSQTAKEIALAIRDEVQDLEAAGLAAIQVDEPALREGLPLRRTDWAEYLRWSVDAFRLATAGVRDDTQIHTHMCYCEFNDIIRAIAELDADVISIESSRSNMELLDAFREFKYPNDVGPGVYDIHSPRVPSVDEALALLQKAKAVLPAERLWVNPDCGLKTRHWPEVELSLKNMVAAARLMRNKSTA